MHRHGLVSRGCLIGNPFVAATVHRSCSVFIELFKLSSLPLRVAGCNKRKSMKKEVIPCSACQMRLIQLLLLCATDAGCDCMCHFVVAISPMPPLSTRPNKSSSTRRPFTVRLDLFDFDGFVVCRLAGCSRIIGVQRNGIAGVRASDVVVGVVRGTSLLVVKSGCHCGLFGGHPVRWGAADFLRAKSHRKTFLSGAFSTHGCKFLVRNKASFLTDNGASSKEFTSQLAKFKQVIRLAGVGAHHHDTIAERSI